MITEDHLEQLAIQWFQDTGWSYVVLEGFFRKVRSNGGMFFGTAWSRRVSTP